MAGFPTGIAVVAAHVEGRVVGMPANSLVSVSLDPPLVSISFARTSTTWPALRRAPHWGISILEEGQEPVLQRLRRSADERFDDIDLDIGDDGQVLLQGSLATLTGTRYAEVDAGDHVLTLLDVRQLDRGTASRPLVFFDSTIHQLAH
ncbi:flavin reductase family protein [Plantibacter sp. VKM Ac-2880]|nr:flavin reductase family protein [Plantibacter sp. VKM Ac-2880]MBF4567210.1 flavin reductase family protein [Plantibacter sp. VKM Ac-2880]